MEDKKALRKRFSALRRSVRSPEKDVLIAERLLSLDRIKNADIILMYASFGTETDTWDIARKLIAAGKTIAYPLCGEKSSMTFHTVENLSQLIPGSYGIPEPPAELPQPVITEDTVCLVPGLAFTAEGARLGYGGGYYDRFLPRYPQIYTIAPAYGALVTDELPQLGHDFRINMIVTEERTVLCRE